MPLKRRRNNEPIHAEALQQRDAFGRTKNKSRGGQRVRQHRGRRDHSHAGGCLCRASRAWIKDVMAAGLGLGFGGAPAFVIA